jgi:hypothetical protein
MVHGCWVDSHSTVLVGVDLGEHACTHMCRRCGLMAVITALRTKALLLLAPWSINVGCAASSVWNVTLFFFVFFLTHVVSQAAHHDSLDTAAVKQHHAS